MCVFGCRVCVHVLVCIHMSLGMHIHVYGGQRSLLGVFLSYSLVLSQGLSVNVGLADLARLAG